MIALSTIYIYITFIFKNKVEPFEWWLDVPCVKSKCKVHQFLWWFWTLLRPTWVLNYLPKVFNSFPLQMAERLARVGFWWELSQFILDCHRASRHPVPCSQAAQRDKSWFKDINKDKWRAGEQEKTGSVYRTVHLEECYQVNFWCVFKMAVFES